MKLGHTLRLQLGFLAAAAIVVTALAYSVMTFRDFDTGKDILIRSNLRDLATLNAKLDADTLEARDGLRPNYDEVVDTARAVLLALRNLESGQLGDMRLANPGIDGALKTLNEQLLLKMRLLDDIKFRHAVVVNSSHFFPHALADVLSAEPSIRRGRSELEDEVIAYLLTSGANQANLDSLIKQLKNGASTGNDPAMQIALLHAAKLAAFVPLLDADTHQYLDIPSALTISALMAEYNTERSTREQRANWVRLALAMTSIGLLASFALILRQIWRTNASAQRFVPIELLNILGRSSIADVKRGDAVATELHILFADIRRFSERIEKSAPAEAFAFMNEYLAAMGAPIAQHRGFITEYRGDGIFALFPGQADDAVRAALGMLRALAQLNHGRADPVEIGVGLHSGAVMLGTFGATERMNAGVISTAVVMAARIESLCKQYKAPLLISEATHRLLSPHEFKLRQVDQVLVIGSSEPILIYDAPFNVPAAYDEAMTLYRAGNFCEARAKFEQIANDPVAASLAKRCLSYETTPPAGKWNGVFVASEK